MMTTILVPENWKLNLNLENSFRFRLIELLFSFIFLDFFWGGLYDEHIVNQQFPFQNWGGGLIRRGLICRNIRYLLALELIKA